ncbi:2-amino-4-hydroxy-6-hydroxymethyldihydropteridine diphosphokinase [Neptunomonas marina]|uniref:2-amino-4-hydroxy-6-hydroxymethyldihydropteridine diphosphokinase n=1 Tax=Neptunomonas marina TaxID=1815562 RepID=A0A437Q751_9GAMM|nr:2-amino-4-hydroxy-6-hydroxymethyldihydropteridine diphosphokinase [Neptunomonas marina]RVU30339.1 2-amino-4-hydroxy-6-hydroxymethyldihydropteridine diphosphokinase [Neptunomonas marina]
MAQVYLSLGSNIDRYKHISAALDALAELFGELDISSVFESEAVGFNGNPFLNLAVGVTTDLSVGELLSVLKAIEDNNGRTRGGAKFAPRTLDIDILTYDERVGDIDGVQLPRDEILYNAFVLWPLAEIAPRDYHPIEQQTYSALWQAYDKQQKLKPVAFTWRARSISNERARI